MYCGTNKQALCSQMQICDALIRLMERKPFAQVSVSELCKEADVARQTFYSLFSSKENVVLFALQRGYCCEPVADAMAQAPAAGEESSCETLGISQVVAGAEGRKADDGAAADGGRGAPAHVGTTCHVARGHAGSLDSAHPALADIAQAYASYIVRNRDFLRLLVDNEVTYLLHDGLLSSIEQCSCASHGTQAQRVYAANYLAGAVTGVIHGYARQGCVTPADELQAIIERLLGGEIFR